LITRHCF